ncbi:MAG TPA: exodeoxyribonuclease VII large subunit, partial [Acidothermaceae bacterium]|nr:exodeoxyribonuclease VII large subunit [Acidothermaceae bacterium]
DEVVHLLARVRSLSPSATLERGYAIVQDADGHVLRSAGETSVGAALAIRLATGRLNAQVAEIIDPGQP